MGRFLNADDIGMALSQGEQINGLNLYSYCLNNPVMLFDSTGASPLPWWAKILIGIGAILILGVVTVVSAGVGGIAISTAFQLAGSAMLAATKVAAIGGLVSGGIGAVTGGITSAINGDDFFEGVLNGFVEGFSTGFMVSALVASTSMSIAAIKGNYVTHIGIMKPSNKNGNYIGAKYTSKTNSGNMRVRSLEIHGPHNGHGFHWQINKWNTMTNSVSTLKRFPIWQIWRLFF